MSIRGRLVLWFGAVFAAVVVAGSTASYAFHVRAHYEAVDHALLVLAERSAAAWAGQRGFPLTPGESGIVTVLRLYDRGGRLREAVPAGEGAPALDPRTVLADPAGPAYGWLPRLAPSLQSPRHRPGLEGAYGLLWDGRQRWRAFVAAVPGPAGDYVVALAPLGALDSSMAAFRLLLTAVGALGLAAAAGASWLIAGAALRPVTQLIHAARAITASRDLSRRVEVRGRDELALLASTFNDMLDSLEAAYRAQQRFVADASHELRAPLTAILGNLELLRRRPDMPAAEREQALAEAEREASRLGRLVADLLALARADAGVPLPMRPVDLDAVLLEAFGEARLLARGQRLEIEDLEPVRVAGDPDRLKQLLLILLDNAIKYTPADGRVTIGLRRDGPEAELTVHDTGVGIPPQDLPHVFERFYRADPARSRDPGGTGLGLPIARWIVEQHGGRIELESEPGRGTVARVRLPLGDGS